MECQETDIDVQQCIMQGYDVSIDPYFCNTKPYRYPNWHDQINEGLIHWKQENSFVKNDIS